MGVTSEKLCRLDSRSAANQMANPNRFGLRVEELVAGHPTLEIIGKGLLAAHEVLLRELNGFEKRVRQQVRQDERVRLACRCEVSDLSWG